MRSNTRFLSCTLPRASVAWYLASLLLVTLVLTTGCQSPRNDAATARLLPQTANDMLAALGDRRVLFVGELHTRYDHHLLQLEALRAMHQQDPRLAIGVEWFQQPFQQHLDDYIAGRIDEQALLHRSEYYERWRFDYRLYRPILAYAREHGIPVIALNAPAELTNAIREHGVEGLAPALAAQLPGLLDRSNQAYTEELRLVFEQHAGADERSFARFVDVQLTWDEAMAERAARYLAAHPERRMIVFAGRGHVQHGWGIPDRLTRRSGLAHTILLPADEPLGPADIADYVVLSQEQTLPRTGLLGVMLEDSDQGVKILGAADDSAAIAAGMAPGDIILSIDEQATATFAAVKLALMDRAPGDQVVVRYRRAAATADATAIDEASVTLR
jgi:uncharacterized iron-regulated protein